MRIITKSLLAIFLSVNASDKAADNGSDIVPAPITQQPDVVSNVDCSEQIKTSQFCCCFDLWNKCDTCMQQGAAKYINRLLFDFEGDENFDIRDCTLCQKRICCVTAPCTCPLIYVVSVPLCLCGGLKCCTENMWDNDVELEDL